MTELVLDEMLAYVPKPPNDPSISQQDHDFGFDDTPMKDATAEEEKKHAPTQSSSDRKDARAECESAITQLSKSDQQVGLGPLKSAQHLLNCLLE